MPKSYLSDAEKEGLSQEALFAAESLAAGRAGDENSAWEWLAMAKLPSHRLLSMKKTMGADFILEKGLRTDAADAAYGNLWLERSDI